MGLQSLASALGGEICGDHILAPGPDHSPRDRSMAVWLDSRSRTGIRVHSFSNDDWKACMDYAVGRLGGRAGEPSKGIASRPIATQNDRIGFAVRLWNEARPIIGTLAEKYFKEHRGLDITPVGDISHAVRWHQGVKAVIALMTDPVTYKATGVHRTFLSPGGAKLDRKMLGQVGVIRLSPDDYVELGLGICEGLEDGLAVLLSGWAPVWVATSVGAIARFSVIPTIESLTIFADADEAGTSGARACALNWRGAGREVVIEEPIHG